MTSDDDAAPTGGAATGEGLPEDIAFLAAHGVPEAALSAAARLAAESATAPAEALLANGLCVPDAFYRALGAELGVPFLPAVTLSAATHPRALEVGIAPLEPAEGLPRHVAAPRGAAVGALLARPRGARCGLALTTPEALREAVFDRCGAAIAHEAANGLAERRPELSIRGGATRAQRRVALGAGLGGLALALLVEGGLAVAALLASVVFLALSLLRLAACLEPAPPEPADDEPLLDEDLPVYTILAPLHDEARVAAQLCRNLRRLDYPLAKLDIKLLVEAHDASTIAALRALDLPGAFEILVAPAGAPRTKPRALNVALPLARGAYVVIYDAEDRPEPDQLRRAVAAFDRHGPDVACLQARLSIDHARENPLTALFAVEYAALFDVVNPGLLRMGLPIPLGGTSNHFRTPALRRIGGWDAWNVTEDADMGLRLAGLGLRTADLPSTTWEEAPTTTAAWLGQRTRWMKGYVQTLITHTRAPARAARALGPARLCATLLLVGGTVASALLYPVSLAIVAVLIAGATVPGLDLAPLDHVREPLVLVASTIATTAFGAGFAVSAAVALEGLRRRRRPDLAVVLPALPVYWAGVSLAAWRALVDLRRRPHHWEKTAHGLAARRDQAGAGERAGPAPAE